MRNGIAQKLIRTYAVIIATTVISGAFCLYVLGVNLRTNSEMRYVTLPSLEYLKEMRAMLQEVKKLADTRVYIANNKDKERLDRILNVEYPGLDSALQASTSAWKDKNELDLYKQIRPGDKAIIESVRGITQLLSSPESYADDAKTDSASELDNFAGKQVKTQTKLYTDLISVKENNFSVQQSRVSNLLDSLYIIVLLTIITVLIVSYVSSRYSQKHVVGPLLRLNDTILKLAVGEIAPVDSEKRSDEIGQMYSAVSAMVKGVIDKINFAEQIGKERYDAEFTLLSEKDKLGLALLTMRNDLKRSNATLLEHEKRLVDAQKLARIGNYFYDIEQGTLQSSATLDDILGLEKTAIKKIDWKDHVQADFHDMIAEKIVEAIKARTKFEASYKIRRSIDNEEVWVNTIGEYNYNGEGKAVSIFGTIQDVTQQKRLEIDLNTAYKVATAQNNKLLNFSYIVSHNLRMHAVNIHSLLDLIKDASSEEERRELMGYLKTSSDQLNETLHHLNNVVAIRSAVNVEIKPLVLKEYADRAIDLLKTKIDNKDGCVINNITEDVVVNYYPVYLDSILLNFISNSIKYSHPDRAPHVILNCQKESNGWILEITDNGLGIDLAKNKDKLFGMYKTFHGNADAQGIGLFMSRYQIEAMGGDVSVESTVNTGTTFRIYIK